MSVYRIRTMIPLMAVIAATAVLAGAGNAQAAAPDKLTLTSQFGEEVNLTQVRAKGGTALEDVCTVASKDECKLGTRSSVPGAFQLAESVAVAPSGDVYVLDAGNKRIQEFSAGGQFVLMFGWDVNKTKVEKATATQQEMNVCTEVEIKAGGECQAGVEGGAPGQFGAPYSMAVDPGGDVYVAEFVFGGGGFGQRVQKLTSEGRFVFEIGKDVNEAKGTNLCTDEEEVKEKVKCRAPGVYVQEPGAFNFEQGVGNLLAAGPEGKLYVGDEGRVQEFNDETGELSGEIALEAGARVFGLAVDETGDLYLTDSVPAGTRDTVREFEPGGKELTHFAVSPEEPGATVRIRGLALDGAGHLAVAGLQQLGPSITTFGSLYEANSATRLTTFQIPVGRAIKGLGFSPTISGDLYVAAETSQEILQYAPKPVAALATGTTTVPCALGPERETNVTLDCALDGEIDPEGVAQTEAWFEWGRGSERACGLESSTPKRLVAAAEKIEEPLPGLRPNEAYCYRFVAEDENAKAPEPLQGALTSITTQLAAPRIVDEPEAQFVKVSSAVMFDELNPENAPTRYVFEYAPGAKALAHCNSIREECFIGDKSPCSGTTHTPLGQSGAYGAIGATSEAVGLRPGTQYGYRLFAENENAKGEKCATTSGEGSFTTATVPSPSAATGGNSFVGATSAVVQATVTPDGASVTYSFELGVYEGAATRFGVVATGSVEPDGGPVEVLLPLSGLQPGTAYAYRIAISSGYIDNETHTLQGDLKTFVTSGLPAVLQPPPVLAQLPAPPIAFPRAVGKAKPKPRGKAKKKSKRGKAKKGKKGRRSDLRRAR
jgi:hypothetical protein